ncbi:ribonuclease HII [Lentisphaerota bacterium ZTH]|nr:ribonuclease HII [Lentisphaerota bacterium]WET06147.1 ribonuclease HII [Lentisphaerota bacterium ZTH]
MDFLSADSKLLSLENSKWAEGFSFLAGIDEAGRGPLAGPVVAAAVVFPRTAEIPVVNDSKQLTEEKRFALRDAVMRVPEVQYAIAVVDAATIDKINILQATHLAMRQAVEKLENVDFILVDGRPVPGLPCPSQAVVKGDSKSASIAAASILAKVHRDELMGIYAEQFPEYGFADHKGYGTAGHLKALKEHGVSPVHRRTFAPVRDIIEPPPEQLTFF